MLTVRTATSGVSIDVGPLVLGGSSIHGWPSGHSLDCEDALRFAKLENVKCMVDKFPFEKAADAYQHTMNGKARFRSVIVM